MSQYKSFSTTCVSGKQALLLFGLLASLLPQLGCQCLHPFSKKTVQGLVSAKQTANIGMAALQNGRLEQAKRMLTQAAQQNPKDASVRENLARTLSENGETEQAILQMQHAVELSKGDPRLVVELGEMYLNVGKWLLARQQAETALKTDHRCALAWALSGKVEKAKANYPQALADFQRALGYAPDLAAVQMELADTYQKLGKPHRALSALEQILASCPSDDQPETALLAKSSALLDLNHYQPAIEILQTASEKAHASSDVFVRLGEAQRLAGQISDARATLKRGEEIFPNLRVFPDLITELESTERQVASAKHLLPR